MVDKHKINVLVLYDLNGLNTKNIGGKVGVVSGNPCGSLPIRILCFCERLLFIDSEMCVC